ncbi:hypothetical protein V1477_005709 [Vespula maculifrons]|uniref:Uncharacterized protein n=1 Tax=Vespula maculifrons TaxID=7453 RepID=A0ABD2CLS7_VESMC
MELTLLFHLNFTLIHVSHATSMDNPSTLKLPIYGSIENGLFRLIISLFKLMMLCPIRRDCWRNSFPSQTMSFSAFSALRAIIFKQTNKKKLIVNREHSLVNFEL